MKIKLNNKDKILPDNISLEKLVSILGYNDSSSFAIALNEDVISKDEWKETKLNEGDNVLIIQATCGG
ncbi:MAG: sulfur carrier protein ThiS [Bacteroidales bacterium]|jgi:sulfur carrier protein|nr:sulfur carrier protein ThiS [Bacteroidales bacterium]MDD4545383.1 sulfur carrier protein ThiS [Bacteroidales bacterium]MDY0054094.1 sulfur carrier protein ThiS [Bacteroidales bacterium]